MEKLDVIQMEDVQGGDFWSDFCKVVGAGSIIYAVGVEAMWWNPVGWVSAGFLGVDAACLIMFW